MPQNYILTKGSVILCPHGGSVTHHPTTYTSYRVNGEVPLLLNDLYFVVGCPFTGPCTQVSWTNPSTTVILSGVPVLVHTSTGICQSAAGIPQGAAIIASYQMAARD
jgi:hypothetical protein